MFMVLLLAAIAACTSDPIPTPASTSPASGTGVRTATCSSVVGGTAAFQAQVEPPPPDELAGAGEPDEIELNDETAPEVPKDPTGEVPDLSGIPRAMEAASGAQGDPEPDDVVLYREVTTINPGTGVSTVAEPQVGLDGNNSLVTWNWLAGLSTNGGTSYGYVNPSTAFPTVHGGFCCDQQVFHVASQDLWLWVLQYTPGPDGSNTIRLAWADDGGFEAGHFDYIDWTAGDLGLPGGLFLDQTKLAATGSFAYLSVNAFDGDEFDQAVIIRVPLDGLKSGVAVSASCVVAADPATGARLFGAIPARGAADTMYLAVHVSDATLGVFRWRDSEAAPTFYRVTDYDANGAPITYPAEPRYTCLRPGSLADTDWCLRPSSNGKPGNDARPTSAWIAHGHLGIAWNASQSATAPYPFAWVVVLDEGRLDGCIRGECVLGYRHIASNAFAIQYAAIVENASGELGAVALIGGGDRFLSCAMLVHEAVSEPDPGWQFLEAGRSTTDLPRPKSGDYLGIALDGPDSNAFIGTCMSYQKAGPAAAMVVHVGRFGRFRDDPFP